ncbi:hypothetical protein SMY29_004009 [Cronobacter sakazakii]|nr:hypothetical protein [Cronobacter sakazakii]
MLSDQQLNSKILNNEIFDAKTLANKKYNVRAASIDLTVKCIHVPNNKKPVKKHIINPGETVIIELNESFSLSTDLAGIIFPKNDLSKNGIIMTNPGHIDPGYTGIVSIYLVNMSKVAFPVSINMPTVRLLVFNTTTNTSGFPNGPITQIEEDQLSRMDKDFAGINTRISKRVSYIISKWTMVFIGTFLAVIAIILSVVPIASQYATQRFVKNDDLEAIIKQQQKELTNLKDKLTLLELKREDIGVNNKPARKSTEEKKSD